MRALFLFLLLTCPLFAQDKTIAIGSYVGHYRAEVPVFLTTDEPVDAFVLAVETELDVVKIDCPLDAEFISSELVDGGCVLGVVVDAKLPYTDKAIPAGDTEIAMLTVEPRDQIISFGENMGTPPLSTHVAVGMKSIYADEGLQLIDGEYIYENTGSKGDVNADGFLDVSDAVYLLDYLFNGGNAPK